MQPLGCRLDPDLDKKIIIFTTRIHDSTYYPMDPESGEDWQVFVLS